MHASLPENCSLALWDVFTSPALGKFINHCLLRVSTCQARGLCFAPIHLRLQLESSDLLKVHLGLWRWLRGPQGQDEAGRALPQQRPEENPSNTGLFLKIKEVLQLCPLSTWPDLACGRHSTRVIKMEVSSRLFLHHHPTPSVPALCQQ